VVVVVVVVVETLEKQRIDVLRMLWWNLDMKFQVTNATCSWIATISILMLVMISFAIVQMSNAWMRLRVAAASKRTT